MTEQLPTLPTRALNRALLARQLLLERSELPLTRALERVGGLQTQYAPSGYVGLWSRLRDFRREDLTDALERRDAVQGTLMRSTIHIVSRPDYPLLAEAIRRGRRAGWLRVRQHQLTDHDMEAVAVLLRKHLADGPRRQAELVALLEAEGFPRIAWSGAGLWLDLVRVPPSGTWKRRRADLYGLAEGWLGPWRATEAQGLEHLLRRYLGGFGPASAPDAASWAGLPLTTVRPVLERLGGRRFRDERGGLLFDLPGAPLPDPDAPAPVRFLPTWDATLLGHARRAGVLPEEHRTKVFHTKMPQSTGTFLVDGRVAGTWRPEGAGVTFTSFGRLDAAARRAVDDEAEQLSNFIK
jgi:hypothetical protein